MSGCRPALPFRPYGESRPTSISTPIEGRKGQPVLKPGPRRQDPPGPPGLKPGVEWCQGMLPPVAARR